MSDPLELLDILDNNGNILYQETKKVAHEKGLLHKTVLGLVINSKGEHVLVKQSSSRQDAGQYVCPVGGHVQEGESEEDALKRETLEEIGLRNFEFKLIGRKIFNREVIGRKENHFFVLFEIYTDQEFVLNHESVEFEAFSIHEIKDILKKNPKKIGNAHHFLLKNYYKDLYE